MTSGTINRYFYLTSEHDAFIQQLKFTKGHETRSETLEEILNETLVRRSETGELTVAQQMDERARYRKQLIDEATAIIDEHCRKRWELIKEAISKVDADLAANVPLFRCDENDPSVIIRRLNGVEERGRILDGAFKPLDSA